MSCYGLIYETNFRSTHSPLPEKLGDIDRFGRKVARWKAEDLSFSKRQPTPDRHYLSKNANSLNLDHCFLWSTSQDFVAKPRQNRRDRRLCR